VNDFIEQKFEKFLNGESRVTRMAKPTDKRVHCCLYFIAPTGHGMKALDIEFMKRLHDKVNIIPVISKADAMTPEEIKSFKAIINQQIAENLIHVYNFPDLDGELDGRKLRSKLPFAVIGSNYVMEGPGGKRVRARQYPWGFAEIENTEHCDFSTLRKMLLQSHMQDLVDTTANQHYEMYRQRKLSPVVTNMDHMSSGQESQSGEYDPNVEKNPIEQIEDEKRNHKTRMAQMEKEMEQVFQLKVQEKRKRLKDSEIELQRRHEQMKKKMEEEWDSLESRRQQFDNQRRQWEEQNKSHIQKMESKLKKEQGKNRGIF
jgi:septin 7